MTFWSCSPHHSRRAGKAGLWSPYQVPSDLGLLPSLEPIADLTRRKRKLTQEEDVELGGQRSQQQQQQQQQKKKKKKPV